jgi:hypothetical protein
MKVSVFADAGELLWSREINGDQSSGLTSTNYLHDGTQEKIILSLRESVRQACGQLGLDESDVISERRSTAGVHRNVPVSCAGNDNPDR